MPGDANSVEIRAGKTFFAAAEKISSIRTERNANNAPSDDRLAAVLAHELASLRPREFNQVLLEQSQRLQSTGKPTLVDDFERDFRSFKSSVHQSYSCLNNWLSIVP
jgi:hypothetical protein